MINLPMIIGEAVSFSPSIFRYAESRYTKIFFADGSIRLSSLRRFQSHKDEQRGDSIEGRTLFIHRSEENGGQTLAAWMNHGLNAYVLSCSLTLNMQLLKDFGVDSVFEIVNILGFGTAISKHIPRFQRFVFGPCFYQQIKVIERQLGFLDEKKLGAEKEQIKDAILNSAGWHPYFQKPTRFSHQTEFRLIWLANESADYLDIAVPEAIQYCKDIKIEGGLFMDEALIPKDPGPPDQIVRFGDL